VVVHDRESAVAAEPADVTRQIRVSGDHPGLADCQRLVDDEAVHQFGRLDLLGEQRRRDRNTSNREPLGDAEQTALREIVDVDLVAVIRCCRTPEEVARAVDGGLPAY
jgi:hypothetical protein